jgi:hypothetical protein
MKWAIAYFAALVCAYTPQSFSLLQADEETSDSSSIFDYIDNTELTDASSEDSDSTTASQEMSDAPTLEGTEEEDPSESPHHNTEAEAVDAPEGEGNSDYGDSDLVQDEQNEGNADYSGSLQDEVDQLTEENEELKAENTELKETNQELEDELVDTMIKVDKYRISEQQDSERLQDELEYSRSYRESLEQQQEAEADDDDSQAMPGLQASDSMTFVVGIGLVFFLLTVVYAYISTRLDLYMKLPLQTLFSDVSLLGLFWAFTLLLYLNDGFDEDAIDLEPVLTGIAIFILVWLAVGLWLLFAAQSHARRWQEMEEDCFDLRKLKNRYEEAYSDFTDEEGPKITRRAFEQARTAMQYAVMRRQFISPPCQVIVTETLLRSDFDLSEYLSKALGQVLSSTLQISWMSYGLLVIFVVSWRLLVMKSHGMQYSLLVLVPLGTLVTLLVIRTHLVDILYELVPYIWDPYEVNFDSNFSREPILTSDKLPRPPYMRGRLPPRQSAASALGMHPLQLTCSFIFTGRFPNRHDLLFVMDAFGPKFVLYNLQTNCILMSLWFMLLCFYFAPMLYSDIGYWSILVVLLSVLVWLYIVGYVLPESIRSLCLTTKIGLMKDRSVVGEVIAKSKADRVLRANKIYRTLKLLYRDLKKLPEVKTEPLKDKLIEEAFALCADQGALHISQLDNFTNMFGYELDEDELRVFAKECEPDEDFYIELENFKRASQRLAASSLLEPEEVVLTLFRRFFKSDEEQNLSVAHIEQFFSEHGYHLTEEEAQEFLQDIRFLLDDGASMKLKEFAYMIRDAVESLPR